MEGTKCCYYFQDIIHRRETTESSDWIEMIFKISAAELYLVQLRLVLASTDSLKTMLAKK